MSTLNKNFKMQLDCSRSRSSSDSGVPESPAGGSPTGISGIPEFPLEQPSIDKVDHVILVKLALKSAQVKPEAIHLAIKKHDSYIFFKVVKLTQREGVIQSVSKYFADIIDKN